VSACPVPGAPCPIAGQPAHPVTHPVHSPPAPGRRGGRVAFGCGAARAIPTDRVARGRQTGSAGTHLPSHLRCLASGRKLRLCHQQALNTLRCSRLARGSPVGKALAEPDDQRRLVTPGDAHIASPDSSEWSLAYSRIRRPLWRSSFHGGPTRRPRPSRGRSEISGAWGRGLAWRPGGHRRRGRRSGGRSGSQPPPCPRASSGAHPGRRRPGARRSAC
jgi:hypothetical protein